MKKFRRKIPAGMIAIALLLQAGMTTVSAANNDAPEPQAVSVPAEPGQPEGQAELQSNDDPDAQAEPVVQSQTYTEPTVDKTNLAVYANGLPITIEAGNAKNTTKIKYGNNSYVQFNGSDEADLSAYTIYGGGGGKDDSISGNTSVTMTGGTVIIFMAAAMKVR